MYRLILSHAAIAAFTAAIIASWKGLVTFYANEPAAIVAIVVVYGGLTLYIATTQAAKALHEARQAATYPAKVRNIAHRFDLSEA